MARLRGEKISPLKRYCGQRQDPECVAKWHAFMKDWNRAYRAASKAQKLALKRQSQVAVPNKGQNEGTGGLILSPRRSNRRSKKTRDMLSHGRVSFTKSRRYSDDLVGTKSNNPERKLGRYLPWVLGAAGLGVIGFVIWKRSSIVSAISDFTNRIVSYGQEGEFSNAISPEARPYAALILQVAKEKGVDPFLIAAVGQRESGWGRYLKLSANGPIGVGPAGAGDWTPRNWTPTPMPPDGLGWGRGLMQLDYLHYKDAFDLGLDWRDPLQNVRTGADRLLSAQRMLSKQTAINGIADGRGLVTLSASAAAKRNVAPGQYPDPRPLVGEALVRATLAAYNTGEANALRSLAVGLDPDTTTTGANYASNAISSALKYAASFNPVVA
jgi:soluble lytic murein transglycosylase-like protein